MRDSSRESNVVTGRHEQTSEDDLQDHQLAKLHMVASRFREYVLFDAAREIEARSAPVTISQI